MASFPPRAAWRAQAFRLSARRVRPALKATLAKAGRRSSTRRMLGLRNRQLLFRGSTGTPPTRSRSRSIQTDRPERPMRTGHVLMAASRWRATKDSRLTCSVVGLPSLPAPRSLKLRREPAFAGSRLRSSPSSHKSTSSGIVRITGTAFGWIGATTAFDSLWGTRTARARLRQKRSFDPSCRQSVYGPARRSAGRIAPTRSPSARPWRPCCSLDSGYDDASRLRSRHRHEIEAAHDPPVRPAFPHVLSRVEDVRREVVGKRTARASSSASLLRSQASVPAVGWLPKACPLRPRSAAAHASRTGLRSKVAK
jgi:hypothetical protein